MNWLPILTGGCFGGLAILAGLAGIGITWKAPGAWKVAGIILVLISAAVFCASVLGAGYGVVSGPAVTKVFATTPSEGSGKATAPITGTVPLTSTAPVTTTLPITDTTPLSGTTEIGPYAGITLIGNTYLNPCTDGANPELQIEELWENGQMIPSAFMALDLNRNEVGKGLRYGLVIPEGGYAHVFLAVNDGFPVGKHYTYQVMGPAKVIVTAATVWCKADNWDETKAGQANIMDATNIPTSLEAIKDLWMPIAANGIMPVPADWLK